VRDDSGVDHLGVLVVAVLAFVLTKFGWAIRTPAAGTLARSEP